MVTILKKSNRGFTGGKEEQSWPSANDAIQAQEKTWQLTDQEPEWERGIRPLHQGNLSFVGWRKET